jgi:hypothetical protein
VWLPCVLGRPPSLPRPRTTCKIARPTCSLPTATRQHVKQLTNPSKEGGDAVSAIKGPLPAPFAAALCHSLAAVGPAHHRARGAALAPVERAQAAARTTPATPQRLEGPRTATAANVLTVARLLATRGAQAPGEHGGLQRVALKDEGVLGSAHHGGGRGAFDGPLARRFHPQFRDKNRRDMGKSQSVWTDSKMETARSR